MPKVSVILTSYNHGKYLREAIDSVLNQTFGDFELIIWDDASSDNSWDIITSYVDPRIKPFRNEEQRRGVWGINKSITEIALGEYIAIHHSDDVWEIDKLAKQVAYLDAHSEIGAVFTWVQIINEYNSATANDWFNCEEKTRWEWLRELFYMQNHLCHPSVLIRRQSYLNVGAYRQGLAQIPDAEMWSRLLIKCPIYVIPEKLTKHRLFSDKSNTSGDRKEVRIRIANEGNVLRENYLSIENFEEIIAIFPALERYRTPKGYDKKFLLAMACLYECKQRSSWQLGLAWLFDLLNDKTHCEKVRKLYSFSDKDFIRLTAAFDVYLIEVDSQLAERDGQLARLNHELAERDARINQIYASRSWRMTSPMRFVSRLMRGCNRYIQ